VDAYNYVNKIILFYVISKHTHVYTVLLLMQSTNKNTRNNIHMIYTVYFLGKDVKFTLHGLTLFQNQIGNTG